MAISAFRIVPSTGTRSVCACNNGLAIAIRLLSETGGVRLWHLLAVPVRRRLEGDESRGTVNVNQRVELFRDPRLKIMTVPLCLRSVDYTNRALQQRRHETAELLIIEKQHELRQRNGVQKCFERAF